MYLKIRRRSATDVALDDDHYHRCADEAAVLLKLWSMAAEGGERHWELLPFRAGAVCAEARIGVNQTDPRGAYADLAELARGHGFELEFHVARGAHERGRDQATG